MFVCGVERTECAREDLPEVLPWGVLRESCRGVERESWRGVERDSERGVRLECRGVETPSLERGVAGVSRADLCRTQSSAAFCQSAGSVYDACVECCTWCGTCDALCRGGPGVKNSGCRGVVANGVMYGVCAEGVYGVFMYAGPGVCAGVWNAGVCAAGVWYTDETPPCGVRNAGVRCAGVPEGGGSLKCSLNHFSNPANESNILCLNLYPSGVTEMYSCVQRVRGR